MRELIQVSQDETGWWGGKVTLSDERPFGHYLTEDEALQRGQEQLDMMKAHQEELRRKATAYDELPDFGLLDSGSLLGLIEDFMNLVDACRQKTVQFTSADGFDLNDCAETINDALLQMGYREAQLDAFWTGEEQLTSS